MDGTDSALPERLRRRHERAQALMNRNSWHHLLIASQDVLHRYGYLEYLTGQPPHPGCAYGLMTAGELPLRTFSERDAAAAGTTLSDLVSATLDDGSDRRVGIVGMTAVVPNAHLAAWRAGLERCTFDDATDAFAAIKADKDPTDHEELAVGAMLVDAGMRVFADGIGVGSIPLELQTAVERSLAAAGARLSLVRLGAHAPLMQPSSREPIRDGQLLTAYVEAATRNGYWVELVRPFAVGVLDGEAEHLAKTCARLQEVGVSMLRPGVIAGEIAETLAAMAREESLELAGTFGHGVGVDDHDPPRLVVGNLTELRSGMAIALHPSLRTASGRAMTVGDTYIVRDLGPVRLSSIDSPLTRHLDALAPKARNR